MEETGTCPRASLIKQHKTGSWQAQIGLLQALESGNSSLCLGANGRPAGTCKWCRSLAVVDQVEFLVFLPLGHLPSLLRLDAAGICSPGLPQWPFKWQFSHLATYLPGQPKSHKAWAMNWIHPPRHCSPPCSHHKSPQRARHMKRSEKHVDISTNQF